MTNEDQGDDDDDLSRKWRGGGRRGCGIEDGGGRLRRRLRRSLPSGVSPQSCACGSG